MTMQQRHFLCLVFLAEAQSDPEIEVVTLQESGTHRQTLKTTWDKQINSQEPQ